MMTEGEKGLKCKKTKSYSITRAVALAQNSQDKKTRLIAHNKIMDVSKFQFNKTKYQTTYLGLFRGYFSVLVGNSVYLAIGK